MRNLNQVAPLFASVIIHLACSVTVIAAPNRATVLNVSVGKPTLLSTLRRQNTQLVMASRTGVVAVFYQKPGKEPRHPHEAARGWAAGYRISNDGGLTWSEELESPAAHGGGQCSGTLRDGGVIIPAKDPRPSTNYTRAEGWKGEPDPAENPAGLESDWFDILFLRFSDDMTQWQTETVRIHQPGGQPWFRGEGGLGFTKGKMVQLPNGDLLSPMSGAWDGDSSERSWVVRSTDEGRTWQYHGTICYQAVNPWPNLPGHYAGASEPSIELLPDGRMLAMVRRQYAHYPGEYLPMSVCWSEDLGKTWTESEMTKPQLMNISPTLQVLENGVVACLYGRPGCRVAFSIDGGKTWQDNVSLSDQPAGIITGQFDMTRVGGNRLVVAGCDSEGAKVWPITVERLQVTPTEVAVTGQITDANGQPLSGALVELGLNRYVLDAWQEGEELDVYRAGPVTVGSPTRGYRAIRAENGYPIAKSDAAGKFHFDRVRLGEYVLTVEADEFAPTQRHLKVGPQPEALTFQLKPGRKVKGQVIDDTGQAVGGACVVLNKWHVHADEEGNFSWSVEAPFPEEVQITASKRYHLFKKFTATLPLSQLGQDPIILQRTQ